MAIHHRILYPASSIKDAWSHQPSGGADWERTKKEGELEPTAPSTSSYIFTSGTAATDNGFDPYTLLADETVKAVTLWVYCKTSPAEIGIQLYLRSSSSLTSPIRAELKAENSSPNWLSASHTGALTEAEVNELHVIANMHTSGQTGTIYAWYLDLETETAEEAANKLAMIV